MKGLGEVLRRIRPGAASERSERAFANMVVSKLQGRLSPAKVVLAGSFAKGTFLEGDKDIDVFVLFKHSVDKGALECIVRAAVENAFPGAFMQIAYAQHPYVRVFLEGRKIDVVPAYEIGDGRHFELKSAVDRTQLHTEYILSKMNAAQKDQVRLLKKFLKANYLYGAEIKIQGFSGYLCELLTLSYGDFESTLKAAAEWKERTFLDLEHGEPAQDALARFSTPLVFLDPVDRERNVSAVVSSENYFAFMALARRFLDSKSKAAFFEKKDFGKKALSLFVRQHRLYCLEFEAPKIVDDVLWGQVRRFQETLLSEMKKQGFELLGYAMDREDSRIQVLLDVLNEPLPEKRVVLGPPLRFRRDCEKFSAQYGSTFVFCGRIASVAKRECRTFPEFAKKLKKIPVPSHLRAARNAKIYKSQILISKCRNALNRYAHRFL
ncbi:MAG: CCA tRNA nucleotidyltransferase [Candidatus ainarchaeum sp.]|nr:CCA tRNA nucleotidyltransferase [Candidatus ainarchaeum sp.]